MKATLALSVLLCVVACIYAKGYGNYGYGGYQQFAYRQAPIYYQIRQQPVVYGAQPVSTGSGSGNPFGGGGYGGYGGGVGVGSDLGIIIPIIIIFVLLAIFAPLLIASLASSNNAFYDSLGSK
ncbi:glycine-rich protein-like [Saccostrea echinata]|uniref:glycine-rich protein-like n=1 Tax=Saccostrea echinata TaxID=191078 RepID=UPI002A800BEE|nr:glycine-rich protein-like [Saccostrea echinata]